MCSTKRNGDIKKAIKDLQAKPPKHVQQRIHILREKPGHQAVVFIGSLGLKGGGQGQPFFRDDSQDATLPEGEAAASGSGLRLPSTVVERNTTRIAIEKEVSQHLAPEVAQRLLALLKEQPNIASWAHVPTYVQALCACWQENEAEMREEIQCGKRSRLYHKLTGYYQELPKEEREALCDCLGELAWHMCIRLEEVPDRRASFTAQPAYWAGKWLAKQWLSGEQQAAQLIAEHKYKPQHVAVFSFLAEEVSKAKGFEGIKKLLSLVEAEPREVLGVQHLLVQMQLLNAYIGSKQGSMTLKKRFA